MNGVFWGCLLILLNLTVIGGRYRIALLGGCAGCIILVMGLGKLVEKSDEFKNARYLSALLVFDIIVAAVFGTLRRNYGYFLEGTEIVDTVITALLQILVLKMITMGIQDMEGKHRVHFGGAELRRAWMWLAVIQTLAVLSLVVPVFPAFTFTEVLAVAMSLIFLVELNRVTRRYQKWEECI